MEVDTPPNAMDVKHETAISHSSASPDTVDYPPPQTTFKTENNGNNQTQRSLNLPSLDDPPVQNAPLVHSQPHQMNQNVQNANQIIPPNSRWNRQARIKLRNLLYSLSKEDIGSAMRVLIDSFGLQGSHIVRRGNILELDLFSITNDYLLDNLYEYSYNIRQNQYLMASTNQMQFHQNFQPTNNFCNNNYGGSVGGGPGNFNANSYYSGNYALTSIAPPAPAPGPKMPRKIELP